MSNVVPITVAATARARQRVYDHFLAWRALSPQEAIEFNPATAVERTEFDRLRKSGIIRQATPGQFWLDLDRHEAAAERRRRKLVPFVLLAAVVAAFGAMLFYRA